MAHKDDSNFASEFWDRLTEFLTKEDDRGIEEIKEDLLAEGIDPEKTIQRVSQLIINKFDEHRLAWRDKARQERLAALQQIQNVKSSATDPQHVRDRIVELLRHPHGGQAELQLQAYFRKLDTITENDLKSILKDLEILELLEESSTKGE